MHRIDTRLDTDRDTSVPIMGGDITSSPTIYDDSDDDAWPRLNDHPNSDNSDNSDTPTRRRPTTTRSGRASTGMTDRTHVTHRSTSTDTDATLIDEVQEDGIQFLPPLPVLMAWHAHILHSSKYEQEVGPDGAYSALRDYTFPLREAVRRSLFLSVSFPLPPAPSFSLSSSSSICCHHSHVQGRRLIKLGSGHNGWNPPRGIGSLRTLHFQATRNNHHGPIGHIVEYGTSQRQIYGQALSRKLAQQEHV